MNLDLTEANWRIRATYTKGVMSSDALKRTHTVLVAAREALPMLRFRFELDSSTYNYRVWLTDGRLWQQTVTFAGDPDPDPGMTFNVPVPWKLTEFAALRDLRNLAVEWRNFYGCTSLRLDPV